MLYSRMNIYALLLACIFASCGSDDIAPAISVLSSNYESRIFQNEEFIIEVEFTDNKDLASASVLLNFDDGSTQTLTTEIDGDKDSHAFSFSFTDEPSGAMLVTVSAIDDCGNTTSEEIEYQYITDVPGTLDLNIKLRYNNEPLVMFQNYEYPDGRSISFNRFSFYISDLALDNAKVKNVEFINLTNSNADVNSSILGYNWILPRIAPGDYDNMNFLVGITPENNEKTPGEYPTNSPLAKPAEHWFSWNSYIFLKVEGRIDLDGDEERETDIALHLGANDALRPISMTKNISIKSEEITNSEIVIDLYDFFGGNGTPYDIDANNSIHALNQLDAVISLADNIPQTFK